MPPKKKAASNQKKERVVPVRVVRPVRSERPEPNVQEPTPDRTPSVPQQKRSPPMNGRRKLMWAGVIAVSIVVFVLWVGYMKQGLASSSDGNDSFFTKIGRDLKDAFGKLKFPGFNRENTNDRALNELRNSVFPDINVQNTNSGHSTNVNQNANSNVNVNGNSNVNTTTNAATP